MPNKSSVNIGFEEKLWAAADKMRNNMDPSEYKHIILGLIFLKYISDSFSKLHEKILKEDGEKEAEDKDYYTSENVFWGSSRSQMGISSRQCKKS